MEESAMRLELVMTIWIRHSKRRDGSRKHEGERQSKSGSNANQNASQDDTEMTGTSQSRAVNRGSAKASQENTATCLLWGNRSLKEPAG